MALLWAHLWRADSPCSEDYFSTRHCSINGSLGARACHSRPRFLHRSEFDPHSARIRARGQQYARALPSSEQNGRSGCRHSLNCTTAEHVHETYRHAYSHRQICPLNDVWRQVGCGGRHSRLFGAYQRAVPRNIDWHYSHPP